MRVCRERCEDLGIDQKRLISIVRRISKAIEEANSMGIDLFVGDNGGVLVSKQRTKSQQAGPDKLVLAELDGDIHSGADDELIQFNNPFQPIKISCSGEAVESSPATTRLERAEQALTWALWDLRVDQHGHGDLVKACEEIYPELEASPLKIYPHLLPESYNFDS